MKRHLELLCPQLYEGVQMLVTTCTQCSTGWDKSTGRCTIDTGAEHLPVAALVPECPIQDRCRHQHQTVGPCAIRLRGMVCESALIYGGMTPDDAMSDALGFSALTVIGEEDLLELQQEEGIRTMEIE